MFKYFNSFSFILITFFFLLFTCICMAQSPYENGGTNSNLFLKMDVTPRAAALGGTFTAIANDENTLLYNTAGLANPRSSFIALNHTQWFDDIRIENMLFTYKMSSGLGMGLGISYMGMPSIQGMSNSNSPTQEFDVSSSIVQLGFGYEIYYGAMLGLGVKYFNENLAGFTAGGVALDAGILFETMVRGLTVGFAVQNIYLPAFCLGNKYLFKRANMIFLMKNHLWYSEAELPTKCLYRICVLPWMLSNQAIRIFSMI